MSDAPPREKPMMAKKRQPSRKELIDAVDRRWDTYVADMDRLSEEFPAPPFGCPGREQPPSAAPLPACEETCSTCVSQYLPELCQSYPFTRRTVLVQHDDASAATEIEQLTTGIKADLSFLRSCIEEHGDTIVKRWHNRTSAKRASLLSRAMPGMHKHELLLPEIHFQALRKCNRWQGDANDIRPGELIEFRRGKARLELLPYVTVETLSRDKNKLLALLHHRTATHPSDWVMFDFHQVRQAFEIADTLPVANNPHCVDMRCDGFGRLVPWTAEAAHRFDIIGYPRARVILMAQARLLAFLRKMAELILDSQTDGAAKGREKWDALSSDYFRTGSSYLIPSALSNSAFAKPLRFHLDPLLDLFRSQHQAACDELDQLQTDPVYTRFRFHQILDTPLFSPRLDENTQVRELFDMLLQKYVDAVLWRSLLEDVASVAAVRHQYGEGAEYDLALRGLHCGLEHHLGSLMSAMQVALCRSKSFSYVFGRDGNGQQRTRIDLGAEDMAEIFKSDLLCWNIIGLAGSISGGLGVEWHLECIDNILMRANVKERSRIDHNMFEKLKDIAALSRALALFQQRRPHHGPMISPGHFSALVQTRKLYRKLHAFVEVTNSLSETGLTARPLREPLEAFLSSPQPAKKVNELTWNRLTRLHDSLARFWYMIVCAIECWVEAQDKAKHPEVMDMREYLSLICTRGTDAFENQLEHERISIQKQLRKKEQEQQETAQALLELSTGNDAVTQTVWGSEPATGIPTLLPKPKAKTRRAGYDEQTSVFQESDLETRTPSEDQITRPPIPVTKASLAVFEQMFNTCSSLEGGVQWSQLVSALVDAGCSATPCGGSAVSFKVDVKGTVVLHRPHPETTVDTIMLKSMGKRLAKWFGWGEGTFVRRVR